MSPKIPFSAGFLLVMKAVHDTDETSGTGASIRA